MSVENPPRFEFPGETFQPTPPVNGFHREPPPSKESSEKTLLGFILRDLNTLDILHEKVADPATLFFYEKHKDLYGFIIDRRNRNLPTDRKSIEVAIRANDDMHQRVGGIDYVTDLVKNHTPTSFVLPLFIDELNDLARRRRYYKLIDVLDSKVQDLSVPVDQLQLVVDAHLNDQAFKTEEVWVKDGLRKWLDASQDRFNRRDQLGGVTTGIQALDKMLDGLRYGEQTLIAARPSIGKTALMMNIVEAACLKGGIPTAVVTCEMSPEALLRRMAASWANINLENMVTGQLTQDDFKRMVAFNEFASKAKLCFIDGVSGITGSDLCSRVSRLIKNHGIKFVAIDYIQKIKPNMRHEKRTYEVGEISGQLRALAVREKVAMLTLAQLNRESDKEKGRVPRLGDLADSGQLERDADTVILLHRDRTDDNPINEATLYVAKQREGSTGPIKTRFNRRKTRFENL